jgi:hypothetical protein
MKSYVVETPFVVCEVEEIREKAIRNFGNNAVQPKYIGPLLDISQFADHLLKARVRLLDVSKHVTQNHTLGNFPTSIW